MEKQAEAPDLGHAIQEIPQGWPFGHVKQINDGGRSVDILVNVLMVPLLTRHVEVYNFILVCIVDVECGLQI